MTLLDVKNHLYSHFLVQSTFSIKDDLGNESLKRAYEGMTKGTPLVDKKEAMFRAALADLERANIILCVDTVAGTYVLTQPLAAAPQIVTVAPLTAHLVAELLNGYGKRTGLIENTHQYVTNKFAITDGDIAAIVQICHALSDEVDELLEMMDFDDEPGSDPNDSGDYDKDTHPFGH